MTAPPKTFYLPCIDVRTNIIQFGDVMGLQAYLDGDATAAVVDRLRRSCPATWSMAQALDIANTVGQMNVALGTAVSSGKESIVDLIAGSTGYSTAVVECGLSYALQRLDGGTLKNRVRKSHRLSVGDHPPHIVTIVSSGNIPGVVLDDIVDALIIGSSVLVKPAREEPFLAVWYAEQLAAAFPALASRIAVAYWEGGRDACETTLYAASDTVVAYGNEDALDGISAKLPPTANFVRHGPKYSLIIADAADVSLDSIATDIALWDQQGCLSPQRILTVGSVADCTRFADRLAAALARCHESLPPRKLSTAAAAERRTWTDTLVMSGLHVRSGDRLEWVVTVDPTGDVHSVLDRTVVIQPMSGLRCAVDFCRRRVADLQCVGLALPQSDSEIRAERWSAAHDLYEAGVPRLCPTGIMQLPESSWYPDGLPPLDCLYSSFCEHADA